MKPCEDGEYFSPTGLKVLVVDDDPFCLTVLERMLHECKYSVTTCSRATKALSILRDRREAFDVVISDVHMPDMDGFKLLELIGLEMDLPVIMMSANGETDAVMKGINYGACDYLVKPVRIEELRNIWQHVVRKRGTVKELARDEPSEEWEDGARTDPLKKKKRSSDMGEEPLRNISSVKKARVVWSFDLHQQFVKAINLVGIDKAVPKRILEVMNIQGLTRENVASHLQKYRLYLKRLSGVNPEPFPIASFQAYEGATFGGAMHVQQPLPAFRSNPSMFGKPLGQYDPGTLATLAQLQALQQAAHEKGQIEAGIDVTNLSQGLAAGLVTFPAADSVMQRNGNGRPVEYGELFTAGQANNLNSYGGSEVGLPAAPLPAPACEDLGGSAASFVPSSPADVSFLFPHHEQ